MYLMCEIEINYKTSLFSPHNLGFYFLTFLLHMFVSCCKSIRLNYGFLFVSILAPMNLALARAAYQSSVGFNGYPEKAVDGNNNTDYDNASCTHTRCNYHSMCGQISFITISLTSRGTRPHRPRANIHCGLE